MSDDIQQAVSRQVGHGDRPAEREAFGRRERAVSRTAKHHAGIARRHDVGAAVAVDIRDLHVQGPDHTTDDGVNPVGVREAHDELAVVRGDDEVRACVAVHVGQAQIQRIEDPREVGGAAA